MGLSEIPCHADERHCDQCSNADFVLAASGFLVRSRDLPVAAKRDRNGRSFGRE